MLKAQAIFDTLLEGCEMGAFVLRLRRPLEDSAGCGGRLDQGSVH